MPGAATDRHGPLHDRFQSESTEPHGPLFDDFSSPQPGADTHGKLFDKFDTRPGVDRYGDRYDEFGWQDMPAKHGQRFDSDFGQPTALDNSTGHGTWDDVFRDGTQVRWVKEGSDYEGTVTGGGREHRICTDHTGERHEVGLSQILQWREATAAATLADDQPKPTAEPGNTPTSPVGGPQGERPSGASRTARGDGGRTPVDPGLVDSTFANKLAQDAVDLNDVAKTTATVMPRKQAVIPDGAVEQHKANLRTLASPDHRDLKKIACPGCHKSDNYHLGHVPLVGKSGQVTSTMVGRCVGKKGCGFTHKFPPPKLQTGTVGKTLLLELGVPEPVLKALCVNCDPTELANQPVVHVDARCERCGGTIVPSAHHADGSDPDRSKEAEHKVAGTNEPIVHGTAKCIVVDVAKAAGATCEKCGGPARFRVADHEFNRANHSANIGKHFCGAHAPSYTRLQDLHMATGKSVDASETATQTQGSAGEHDAWCPACKHTCRRAEDGKCPTCGGKVRDKDAEKARESDADVLKSLAELAGVA